MFNSSGIDIIIVNFYSKNKILVLLRSIEESLSNFNQLQVIIINNSINECLQDLSSIIDVKIIENNENKGFGYACNQALPYLKYNYLLLLNPDTQVFFNTFCEVVSFMNAESDITVLGVKHKNEHRKIAASCSRFPKLKNLLFEIVGLSKIAPKICKPPFVMTDWDHQQSRIVDQVMGAFLLVRKSFVDKYGLLDERYFVFLEDTDFCRKVWDNNGRVFYNANIVIVHEGGNSTNNISHQKMCYMLEGKLKYANKHFSKLQYYILFLFVILIEPITRFFYFLITNSANCLSVIKAYQLFYTRKNFK
jgi:N-acetylglucosaminyl-diphospho-decaprenol L-rhamnosyltransferase